MWQQVESWLVEYGMQIVGAVAILVIGYFLARLGRRIVRRIFSRTDVAPAIAAFAARLTHAAILIFAVIATLARFGVQTTSLVAVLGAASFAVGFALQGSLSNFAAGVLILILRPFRIGDYVEAAGIGGTVKDIHLFTTILATPDNVQVLVPNAKIYGEIIKNYAGYDTRRLDLTVGIGYDVGIGNAIEVATAVLEQESRVLPEPAPQVLVSELADSSVNLILRMWVRRDDYWPLRFDLTRTIKETFDAHGIEIPYPQRVIHTVSS